MSSNLIRIIVFMMIFCLTGCSYITPPSLKRDKSYLCARSVAPIRTLPGLASNGIRNDYPIPDRYYPESEKIVSIVPPGIKE